MNYILKMKIFYKFIKNLFKTMASQRLPTFYDEKMFIDSIQAFRSFLSGTHTQKGSLYIRNLPQELRYKIWLDFASTQIPNEYLVKYNMQDVIDLKIQQTGNTQLYQLFVLACYYSNFQLMQKIHKIKKQPMDTFILSTITNYGNLEVIKWIYKNYPYLTWSYSNPLEDVNICVQEIVKYASLSNNTDIINWLFNTGLIDSNLPCDTSIINASRRGHLDVIKLLLLKCNIYPPLLIQAEKLSKLYGHTHITKYLTDFLFNTYHLLPEN